jgi:hypothetical protein
MPHDFLVRYQFRDLLGATVKILVMKLELSPEFVRSNITVYARSGIISTELSAIFQQRFAGFGDASDGALGAGSPYYDFSGFVRKLVGT